MKLKEISLKDKDVFKDVEYISSDYTFSYIYMFSELYNLKIYYDNRVIIIGSFAKETSFYMPLGDVEYGIKLVLKYCDEHNITPSFTKIPEKYIDKFKKQQFEVKEDRDSFDYIYSNYDLANYAGPDFRRQRNNLSNYLKINTPIYSNDIKNNLSLCKKFTLEHYSNFEALQPTIKILDCIEELNLEGGIVWNENEIQGYCVYEKISDNMAISHVELTNNSHRGVHAYMIKEMSKNIEVEYINKEDDMGLSGLRIFKERYNPSSMIAKYSANLKL